MELLGLKNISRDDLLEYLDLAAQFVDEDERVITPEKYRGSLAEKSVALMFFEPSTRTRCSFELAARRLGAYPMQLFAESSSIRKGESEIDTCQNLAAMGVDAFVIRHPDRHIPLAIAEKLRQPVINAGNGSGEHPSQALIDAFTLQRALGRKDLEGVTVAILGDIVHSRVARSDTYALRALGAKVVITGPTKLLPNPDEGWDVEIVETRRQALEAADAVIVLRIQGERMHRDALDVHAYARQWGVDDSVVRDEMKSDAYVMHPGPVIRGVELAGKVADSERSLILKQAGYGVAIRQAILVRALMQS